MPGSNGKSNGRSSADLLKDLLEYVKTTDLHEVLWEKNGTTLHFRRREDAVSTVRKSSAEEAAAAAAPEVEQVIEPVFIRSTMVGTFYRSEKADRPPLVVEGTVVAVGQPVAAVEAMKITKDVVSSVSCRIVKALVENHQPVEYGQPLFEVELVNENV